MFLKVVTYLQVPTVHLMILALITITLTAHAQQIKTYNVGNASNNFILYNETNFFILHYFFVSKTVKQLFLTVLHVKKTQKRRFSVAKTVTQTHCSTQSVPLDRYAYGAIVVTDW